MDEKIEARFSARMPQELDDREIIEQLIEQHINHYILEDEEREDKK